MSGGPNDVPDRPDRALLGYGRRLAASARGLLDPPYDELLLTLRQSNRLLSGVGTLAQDAAWVEQREGYLADAAERIAAAAARLDLAVTAPLESDVSVEAHATREAVAYFRDITADVLPSAAYRDPAVHLLAAVDRATPAPGLFLQVLPLVVELLTDLHRAGGLADELRTRAEEILAVPMPGFRSPEEVSVVRTHPSREIEAILAELRTQAGALHNAPREDAITYEVAIRDCFELTPGQLARLLSSHVPFPDRARRS